MDSGQKGGTNNKSKRLPPECLPPWAAAGCMTCMQELPEFVEGAAVHSGETREVGH